MRFTREIPLFGTYDVIVAGGGPAGFAAGLAAARGGLKTLLLEAGGCLGGTATRGALPFFLGAYNGSIPFRKMIEQGLAYRDLPRPRRAVCGIFDTVMARMREKGVGVGPCVMAQTDKYPALDRLGCHDEFTFDIEAGKRVFDELASEYGLEVLYYTSAVDTEREKNAVKGVYFHNKGGMQYASCRVLVDCTGDADLVARSGFATYKGDRETGEMTAIGFITHIENIDSAKLAAYLENGGDPWFFEACQKAARDPAGNGNEPPMHLILFPMMQEGVFMVNGGTNHAFVEGRNLDGTDPRDLTLLTQIGRERAEWLVEKLFRPYIPGAENCRLRLTATYPGVRETRRIVGEQMLAEEDLVNGTRFPDTIALAGRHFDLGRKGAKKAEAKGGLQAFASKHTLAGGVASIPYGALIPKGAENLLVAGRCIAADGQALGPARIMSTCMATGEAAGVAAVLALRDGVSVREVNTQELRDTLRAFGAVVDA